MYCEVRGWLLSKFTSMTLLQIDFGQVRRLFVGCFSVETLISKNVGGSKVSRKHDLDYVYDATPTT